MMLDFNNIGVLMLLLCSLKVNTRIKLLLLIHINLSTKGGQMPLCGRQDQNSPVGEDSKKKNTGKKHRRIIIKS